MSTITVQDIERDPASFVSRIESGEALVVVRNERPVAEVKPLPVPQTGTRPDFDAPLPEEILRDFERR